MSEPTGSAAPGRAGAGLQRWLDRWNALVLLVCGAVMIGPSLLGLRTLISVDLLTRSLPWRTSGLDINGHELCTTDTVDSIMPMLATVRRQVFAGHLPVWQNYAGGGADLAGVPDLGALSPLSLPYYVLPLWLAPAFVMLLQIAACVGGSYLFLRRLGTSRAAGLLAGFVYATSGFLVMWSNWPQTRTAAVLPWLLWAVERLVQRRRPADVAVIGLVVAALLFGGFPQVTGFGVYLAAGYLLVRVVVLYRRELRDALTVLGMATGGLLLGVGLAAVQLLPFVSFLHTTDLGYRSTGAQLPSVTLVTTAVPNAYGSCLGNRPVTASVNPVEMIAFIGAAALVLAVAGVAHARRRDQGGRGARSYFGVAAVAVLAIGWLSPLALQLAVHFPVFNGNPISRIRVLLGLVLAVLAGFGYDAVCRWVRRRDDEPDPAAGDRTVPDARWRRWITPAVWAVVTLAVLGFAWHVYRVRQVSRVPHGHDVVLPAVLGGLALLALVVARWAPRPAAFGAAALLPVLVMGQGASFFHTVLPGDSVHNFYPVTGTHRFLSDHLGHDRYAGVTTMFAQTSPYYGLRTPTGHVFLEPAWKQLLTTVDPQVMQSPTNSAFASLTPETSGHSPLLDRMAVRYIAFPAADVAGATPVVPADAPGLPAASAATRPCSITGPLRGIQIRFPTALSPASTDAGMTVTATVRGSTGTRTAARWFSSTVAAGSVLPIPVAGEDLPAGAPLQVSFAVTGASSPLVLSGAGGAISCTAVRPVDDGLRLVYSDSADVVYQRLTSLGRVRWASATASAASSTEAIDLLRSGRVGADTVVLTGGGPAASGQGAQVRVTSDDGASVSAEVTAAGGGYLVLADAVQTKGNRVSVDGHPATLRAADAAMGAVYVPAGRHTVTFSYQPPGLPAGAAVSAVSVLVVFALFWWDRRRRRVHEPPAPSA